MPHFDEAARLPCLTIVTPAAAATKAEVVEILKEFDLSNEYIDTISKEFKNVSSEIEEEMIKNSSSYGLLNELDQEKTKLEEELLEKYERQEYLEDIAKKIEEYNSKKQ